MDVLPNVPWRKQHLSGRPPTDQPSHPIQRKRAADTQEAAWVADEDRFVLQQAKRKAEIRVRDGRARPIDWLAVTLRFVDPARSAFDDEIPESDLDIVDPEGVFQGLNDVQLADLEKDIDVYMTLEDNERNQDFWNTMLVICRDRRRSSNSHALGGRGVESVSSDVDRLLGSKSLNELESLEGQVRAKLQSDEPVDIEYWEHLLHSLTSWKAKAKLRQVSRSIVDSQLHGLRAQQQAEAQRVNDKVTSLLSLPNGGSERKSTATSGPQDQSMDPEPLLKVALEDKALPIHEERELLKRLVDDRKKILKLGYVPLKRRQDHTHASDPSRHTGASFGSSNRTEDLPQAPTAQYEREVARGVGENEEVFAGEEDVASTGKHLWANKHRPRKPKYFNRVQMGYEWNKYNQTHYDHDNPPPRVVHGYKFNIFYPELIDKTKAPTYKIEREHGRKRGQSFAPAGEEDTCLIRFVAGPPYEDIAFRIVDKEWDYSAKRERGFTSSFDKVYVESPEQASEH